MKENMRIAQEKLIQEKMAKEAERAMEKYTAESDSADPFFNEHFDKTQHALGKHRYVPYNFKGLRPDQIEQIKLEREQQMKEAEYKAETEKEEERLWGIQAEHL